MFMGNIPNLTVIQSISGRGKRHERSIFANQ